MLGFLEGGVADEYLALLAPVSRLERRESIVFF